MTTEQKVIKNNEDAGQELIRETLELVDNLGRLHFYDYEDIYRELITIKRL